MDDEPEGMHALTEIAEHTVNFVRRVVDVSPHARAPGMKARFWATMLAKVQAQHAIELQALAERRQPPLERTD